MKLSFDVGQSGKLYLYFSFLASALISQNLLN